MLHIKTPYVLTLHLNRSLHFGHYVSKNTCRVDFPEILDLSPYTTSGQLSTKPDLPISSHQLHQPIPPASRPHNPTLYRLSAVVCHYGQHSFGHYICYRRKPRPVGAQAARFSPPKIPCSLECKCERCENFGHIRFDDNYDSGRTPPGHGWLRISDDSVQEVGFETVALESSSAFMLFYEKILQPRASIARQQVARRPKEPVRFKDAQSKEHEPVQGDNRSQSEASDSRTNGVQPRIFRNVSTRRTDSPIPQSNQKPLSPSISTGTLMRGGSYFSAQERQTQVNGHARMPATPDLRDRPASPPLPSTRESRPPLSNSSPHSNSPTRSQLRVPTPSKTRIQHQPL